MKKTLKEYHRLFGVWMKRFYKKGEHSFAEYSEWEDFHYENFPEEEDLEACVERYAETIYNIGG